jgi:phosphatidylglycerophosphate synthase
VASLNEALPGKLDIKVSALEKIKIAASFIGLSLLIAPVLFAGQRNIGDIVVLIAAALTLATLFDYGRRAGRAFGQI